MQTQKRHEDVFTQLIQKPYKSLMIGWVQWQNFGMQGLGDWTVYLHKRKRN